MPKAVRPDLADIPTTVPSQGKGTPRPAEVTLSWPLSTGGASRPNLLATVAGKLFQLRRFSGLWRLGLRLPPAAAGGGTFGAVAAPSGLDAPTAEARFAPAVPLLHAHRPRRTAARTGPQGRPDGAREAVPLAARRHPGLTAQRRNASSPAPTITAAPSSVAASGRSPKIVTPSTMAKTSRV